MRERKRECERRGESVSDVHLSLISKQLNAEKI